MGARPWFSFLPLYILLMLSASFAGGISDRGWAADRPETFRPGDCRFCHGAEKVIPPGHVNTEEMDLFACRRCHSAPAMSLRGKMPLSHTHQLLGVSCTRCHGVTRPPQPAGRQDCLICHSDLEKLAARTSNLQGNPHQSVHYGKSLDCNLCHHEHYPSENYCALCHSFRYKVP